MVVGDDPAGGESIIGDTVNVAQRLEAAADPGEVLIGEQTARLLAGIARLDREVELAVKGRADHVRARRLIAADFEAADAEALPRTPLVGRAGNWSFCAEPTPAFANWARRRW